VGIGTVYLSFENKPEVKNLFPIPHTHIIVASGEAVDAELCWPLVFLPDQQLEFHDGNTPIAKFLPRIRPVIRYV